MNSVGKNKKSDENIAIKRERTMTDFILSLAGNGRYVSVYANPDDPSAFIYGQNFCLRMMTISSCTVYRRTESMTDWR